MICRRRACQLEVAAIYSSTWEEAVEEICASTEEVLSLMEVEVICNSMWEVVET